MQQYDNTAFLHLISVHAGKNKPNREIAQQLKTDCLALTFILVFITYERFI